MKRSLGVYIHIPFCISKCGYCDFNSYSGMDRIYDEYVNALKNEISLTNLQPYEVISIFFGGGTPTILESRQLIDILKTCRGIFNFTTAPEITIEANPETLTKDKLKELRNGGFNRISIGVQSFNDRLLKRFGRIHDSKRAYQGILSARDTGFENISIDLMFGIPDETLKDWESDIKTALELNPEHISAYNLTIEKGTQFWRETQAKACGYQLPDEDRQLEMYEKGIGLLTSAGYEHYEISNFAKACSERSESPDRRCVHNQIYWRNEEYLGIGAGAYSYINGERRWNIKNPVEYVKAVILSFNSPPLEGGETGEVKRGDGGGVAIEGRERLNDKDIMGETIMMGLRMIDGINLQSFKKRFNTEIQSVFHTAVSKLLNDNLISFNNGYLKLTKKGLLFYNDAAAEFLV